MNVFGADLAQGIPDKGSPQWTLVATSGSGAITEIRRPTSLPGLVAEIAALTREDPFLLGVNIPVVNPARATRSRPFEGVLRKKFGFRLPPGNRPEDRRITGEQLLGALASAGHACLTYPDRNSNNSGLAEVHAGPALKGLLWVGSRVGDALADADREPYCRSYKVPVYRRAGARGRAGREEIASAMDLLIRSLSPARGYDFNPVLEALASMESDEDAERAASLLDACVIAGTARRHLDAPEACVFVGERESGYTILPADDFMRRLLIPAPTGRRGKLFPQATLLESLREMAEVRSPDLLTVRGKPRKIEAVFREKPCYEFENVDEMLWWKRCRHAGGPALPTEGLVELSVTLENGPGSLNLVRSRHTALSFRFHPPAAWRAMMQPRDNKVYRFHVLRASYETGAN